MDWLIYALCTLTALTCSWMLLRTYARSGYKLLLWGGLCFVGLTLNNILLIVDIFIVPEINLSIWRLLIALTAMLVFLYGLIWDSE